MTGLDYISSFSLPPVMKTATHLLANFAINS